MLIQKRPTSQPKRTTFPIPGVWQPHRSYLSILLLKSFLITLHEWLLGYNRIFDWWFRYLLHDLQCPKDRSHISFEFPDHFPIAWSQSIWDWWYADLVVPIVPESRRSYAPNPHRIPLHNVWPALHVWTADDDWPVYSALPADDRRHASRLVCLVFFALWPEWPEPPEFHLNDVNQYPYHVWPQYPSYSKPKP